MRILYLTSPGPDYLADQIYTGLCKTMGWEAVIDHPWKAIYHDPAARRHYIPQTPGRAYAEEELVGLLRARSLDVIVLSSPRPEGVAALEALKDKAPLPPVVLIDGEDDARIRGDLFRRCNGSLYFKREYRWHPGAGFSGRVDKWRRFKGDSDLFARTYPLPFSAVLDCIPTAQDGTRDVDISYAGRISHPKRLRAVNLLKRTNGLQFEGGVYAEPTDRRSKLASGLSRLLVKLQGDPYVSPEERGLKLTAEQYYALLSRSRMGLCLRGGGFDTLRYWEVVACKALLVSEQPDIDIPFNFENGRHAAFCRPDLSNLVDVVRPYLHDDHARSTMAEAAYAHLVKYHTCEQRAGQFLEICRKRL